MHVSEVFDPNEARKALIPLAGSSVSAGFPSPADDYVEKPIDLNEYVTVHPEATFFVRVNGESMLNGGIQDKDILVVDRAETARSGSVVIAMVDGDMVVKRLRQTGEQWLLVAENRGFKPIEITEEIECVIWGVVTHVLHTLAPERF